MLAQSSSALPIVPLSTSIALLIAALLVLGLLTLISKAGVKIVVWLLLPIGLFLTLALFTVRMERQSAQTWASVYEASGWDELPEGKFAVGVYPSRIAALDAMVPMIYDMIKGDPFRGKAEPDDIYLYSDEFDNDVLAQLAKALRKKFPSSTVLLGQPPEDSIGEADVSVTLGLEDSETKKIHWGAGASYTQESGMLVAQSLDGGHRAGYCSVDYIDKPWVEFYDNFLARHGPDTVVGYSRSLASSETLARELALDDARQQLAIRGYNPELLKMDVDSFSQKLQRPYGDAWRAAVMIDVSMHAQNIVVQDIAYGEGLWRSQVQLRLLAMIALAVFASLLYLILNSVTRGYYRYRVVVIVIVFALGGVLLLAV